METNLFESHFKKLVDSVKKQLNVTQNEAEQFVGSLQFYGSENPIMCENTASLDKWVENIEPKLQLLRHHFPVDEILFNSQILLMSLNRICYRLDYLSFFSFDRLRISHLLNFNRIRFMTPKALKEMGFLRDDFDIIASMNGIPEDVKTQIRTRLIDPDAITINELKSIISEKFLAHKFKEQKTKPMKPSSFSKIQHISEKYAHYARTNADIAGEDIDAIIKKSPRILKNSVFIMEKKLDVLLRKYQLSKDQILKVPNVFLIALSTLKARLKYWYRLYGEKFLNHEYAARILVHHSFLKDIRENEPNIDIESLISKMKLYKRSTSTNLSDCVDYLVNQFQLSKLNTEEAVKQHPRWYECDINNAIEVMTCLREANLTHEQIINGLYIILYKASAVKAELQKLDDSLLVEWKKHPLLLDIIIYNIDKEFIFNCLDSNFPD